MLKKGIDRRDFEKTQFYFDDSNVLTSNPPKYKVWYDEDGHDIDYIPCSEVIVIGIMRDQPSPVIGMDVVESHIDMDSKSPENFTSPISENNITTTHITKEENDYITKSEIVEPQKIEAQIPNTSLELHVNEDTQYEYKVVNKKITSEKEVEETFNELGKDRWDLCGFKFLKNGYFNTGDLSIIAIFKRKLKVEN